MLDAFVQDVRYAARALGRRPTFTAVAVLTLALGIGANAAVFSAVRGILLAPLPYAEPERLAAVWPEHFFSSAELLYLQEHGRAMRRVEAFSPGWSVALAGGCGASSDCEPRQLLGARTSTGFFDLLGVRPVLGRAFVPDESRPGNDRVALISHALWRARFGGDRDVVGRAVRLDGQSGTIVGVMPAGFEFEHPGVDVWMPLVVDPASPFYTGGVALAVARLAPGATPASAAAELRTLVRPMREALGYAADYGQGADVAPLADSLVGGVRAPLLVLLGAVGFIVLIAAANVGNLLLVRATERRREIAVRVALGASPAAVARGLVAESLVLSAAGGAADTPRLDGVALDPAVVGVTAAIVVLTGLLFGLAPALLAARTDPQGALRARSGDGGGGSGAGQRVRDALVVAEVALALVLTLGAGLMVRTLHNLARVDPGFRIGGLLTVQLQPATQRTAGEAGRRRYYAEVLERVSRVPGVSAAGAIHHLPLTGYSWNADIEVEGRPLARGESAPRAAWRLIGGDYFRAMGIPLREGRAFDARDDTASAPVAIVSERFARRFWPDESAVGKRFTAGNATRRGPVTIVGVVGDVRHLALEQAPEPELYRPIGQQLAGAMTLTIRVEDAAGDPLAVAGLVREAVRAVDPDVPFANVRTLEAVVAASIARSRLVAMLLLAFAAVGVALGAIGVYGVIAFAVGQRAREIGIRIALGARAPAVVGLVMSRALRYGLAGTALGLAAALGLARALQGLVFGIAVHDPATFISLSALLLAVVAAASLVPARRAARVDPMTVIRES